MNKFSATTLVLAAFTLGGCSTTSENAEVAENGTSTSSAQTAAGSAGDTTTNEQNSTQAIGEDGQAIIEEVVVDPKVVEYQRLMALPNAYKDNAILIPNNVKLELTVALEQKANGDLDSATKTIQTLSEQNPNMSGLKLQLGDLAYKGGNLDLAKAYYQQAVVINPYNYFAHNRLGGVLRKQGDFDAAKTSYQTALDSWGAFAPAHLNLGILFDIYLGDKNKALEHYQTYQLLTQDENRKVKGWIADISVQLRDANNG